VTNAQRPSRPGRRRIEVSFPLTASTDIAFGVSLRVPRRRARKRSGLRRWSAAFTTALLYVLAAIAPIATVAAGPELVRLAALITPTPPAVAYAAAVDPPRPIVRARGSLITTFSDDPPALRTHVVAPEETLLSIAARYAIAPQTLAYDNNISDTAALRVGQSLIVPPFDAAIHVVREGETLAGIAATYGVDVDAIRAADRSTFEAADDTPGRMLIVSVPDARYPGFRLVVSDAPRVIAPRVRWPAEGVITQLFSVSHSGVDIAAPYGSPIVATDAGTVSAVGQRGPGGLAVCVYHDWGLETCAYHAATVNVEIGERVVAGQRIAQIGLTGVTTGPHVHWETRTNGVLVDPMTYAPSTTAVIRVGGATGSP
jgi:murein DD-endopeptidase MepM/ murein hydrolase activator NlpD